MRILLLGKNGQVGWELQRSLAPLGEVIALGSDNLGGNFTDLSALEQTVRTLRPEVIVNAAAYTAVDKAQSEPELARTINALAPGVLAREAHSLGAWLLHYSTEYVFDGSGDQPWLEGDATAPLNVYGQTKLEGEQLIAESGCAHLIFRTSWVYAARGGNFAKTMLRLAQERDTLNVIDDQFGAPTGADLLADVSAHALRGVVGPTPNRGLSGLYHLAASGETSWYGYAKLVLASAQQAGVQLKLGPAELRPIASSSFPTPAPRPHNSRLNTDKLRTAFDLFLPPWQQGLARMLKETL
ncbi:MAG: dTDP-4-dehydrorhamnose reductase [Burkholderiaceae bacterium]